LRPFKAPEGSSLEAHEAARKAGLEQAVEEGSSEREKMAWETESRAADEDEVDEENEGSDDDEEGLEEERRRT
jgi:hypothetical protein